MRPELSWPYRTMDHPVGYNQTDAECKAAAAAMACLVKALAAAKTTAEKNAIKYRFGRESLNCTRPPRNGDIKKYYNGPWI